MPNLRIEGSPWFTSGLVYRPVLRGLRKTSTPRTRDRLGGLVGYKWTWKVPHSEE